MLVEWHTNTVFNSRTYFIEDVGKCWLVDCGDLEEILNRQVTVEGILLTHIHYDHIYGLKHLWEYFLEVNVYTNDVGLQTLANSKKNFSRYHDDVIEIVNNPRVITVNDGEEIDVLGMKAKAFFTPGHAPSCITWQIGEWLFTGDSLIPGVKPVTNLPGGNKELALASEEKIKNLSHYLGLTIMPGHSV